MLAPCSHTLALGLRLPNAELLCDEAVFDHLVNVLFLGEGTILVQIQITHLLADVCLMNGLRMMAHKAMTDQTGSYKVTIQTIRVRSGCPLLMPATRLDLILTQQNALSMDLLESYVC